MNVKFSERGEKAPGDKTGELDASKTGIDAKSLGATLLALGDVDPRDYMTDPEVIEGVLA